VFGEEFGCGVCVDGLLSSLTNLSSLIDSGIDLLPRTGLAETIQTELQDIRVQYTV